MVELTTLTLIGDHAVLVEALKQWSTYHFSKLIFDVRGIVATHFSCINNRTDGM